MAPKQKTENQFVTKEVFDKTTSTILDALESISAKIEKKSDAPITKEEQIVIAAAPNRIDTNPEWDSTAKEILGDYLDHTEVSYEKSGAVKFTIVIKVEKSNAPSAYLEAYKTDRRTKEVGSQGIEGVIEWCRLVRANLKRTETK